MVLSRAAIWDLDYWVGCVAKTVYADDEVLEDSLPDEGGRPWRLSAVTAPMPNTPSRGRDDYGGNPETVLRHLEACGVAR